MGVDLPVCARKDSAQCSDALEIFWCIQNPMHGGSLPTAWCTWCCDGDSTLAQGRVKQNGAVPVPGLVSRFSLAEVSGGSWERKNWQLGRMSLHFPSSCSRLNDVPYLAFLTDRRNLMAETVTA